MKSSQIIFFLLLALNVSHCKAQVITACTLLKPRENYDLLFTKPKEILRGSSEHCILKLIDVLTDSTKKSTFPPRFFELLSQVYLHTDGYVAEHFDEVGIQLFYYNFERTINYILNKNKNYQIVEKIIIQGISMDIISYGSEEQNKLRKFIQKKVASKPDFQARNLYLQSLQRKIEKSVREDA